MNLSTARKIYVAGHRGLLGSAVNRALEQDGCRNIICKTSAELDLVSQKDTFAFFEREKPEYVFLCAAKVGGIKANMNGLGEFFYRNLQIQNNVIEASRVNGVTKLLFVASTCVYPPAAPNPLTEQMLMSGPLEPTNEGYAVAKVAGVKMCEFYRKQYGCNFISAIPCNLFGLNDHYDPDNSHVLQSLIRKVHLAKMSGEKKIVLWGSGQPRREFMNSDDCAAGLLFLMKSYDGSEPVNVGTGVDASIVELAEIVAKVLEHPVKFEFDSTKPDGMFRKLSDVTKLSNLGWRSSISLEQGIRQAYGDFLSRIEQGLERAA